MAKITPFRAHRPPRGKAPLVSSRSYVTYEKESLRYKLEHNPFTYLHVINPDSGVDPENEAIEDKFKRVRKTFDQFVEDGHLFRDEKQSFYLYKQVKGDHVYTGVICGVHIDEYVNGNVKIHEHTLTAREEMFKKYLLQTGVNAEPVLLTYHHNDAIDALLAEVMLERSEYEFASTDGASHYMWVVSDEELISQLTMHFKEVDSLYIADGHHRTASSRLLAEELNEKRGEGAHSYFMSYLISDQSIHIYDFNRLITSIGEMSEAEFLKNIEPSFDVHILSENEVNELHAHLIKLYLSGKWYGLSLKNERVFEHVVHGLDCEILNNYILEPVLGITDLKTDKRVDFMAGPEGIEGIEKAVDSGKFQLAFVLNPVLIDELKAVADADLIMPPKSTYVEPKLRSGLTIYDLFEE